MSSVLGPYSLCDYKENGAIFGLSKHQPDVFVQCSNGIPICQRCPAHQEFNEKFNVCVRRTVKPACKGHHCKPHPHKPHKKNDCKKISEKSFIEFQFITINKFHRNPVPSIPSFKIASYK